MAQALTVAGPSPVGFSYNGVPLAIRDELRDLAGKINRAQTNHLRSALELGSLCAAAKKQVPHGKFTAWIQAETTVDPRLAELAICLHQEYGHLPENFSLLGLSSLYLLSAKSTPTEARAEIGRRIENGERLGVKDVKSIITTHKEIQRRAAKTTETNSRRTKAARSHRQQEAERQKQEAVERNKRREALFESITSLLQQRFGDDLPSLIEMLEKVGEEWIPLPALVQHLRQHGGA